MSSSPSAMRLSSGRTISKDKLLGKGAEGVVYSVGGDPTIVIKLFHEDRRPRMHTKLQEMLRKPASRTVVQGHVVLAWPLDLVMRSDGAFLGYAMPQIADAEKLFKLKNPAARKASTRTRTFMYDRLVAIARNLASAVELAHAEGLVVSDLSALNVLVSSNTAVSLIDVDSFQFVDSSGRVHPGGNGTPEYVAPELVGQSLAGRTRDARSDLFSLGILLYELLMEGHHPYAGIDPERTAPFPHHWEDRARPVPWRADTAGGRRSASPQPSSRDPREGRAGAVSSMLRRGPLSARDATDRAGVALGARALE